MPDPARTAYLAALDDLLPFPPDRRPELIEEIDAHLDDAVAAGLSEAAAQERLGTPRELARELARPEQSATRLLAGVGIGLRAGVVEWIYGFLVGSLLVLVAAWSLAIATQLAGDLLGTGWRLMVSDQGWNTMLTMLAVVTGLYFAGVVLPGAIGVNARRLVDDVRGWVAAVGVMAIGSLLVFVVELPLNGAAVAVLVLAPLGLVAGIYRPGLLPRRLRLSYVAIAIAFVFVPLAALAFAAPRIQGGVESEAPATEAPDMGLSIVGPQWPATDPERAEPAITGGGWISGSDGTIVTDATLTDPRALDGLHGLRLEAWRTDLDTFVIDPARQTPFAVGPVHREGDMLVGEVVTDRDPGGGAWRLVFTGVDDAGTRHVVLAGGGGSSTFHGTAWEWLTAVFAAQ